MTDFPGPLEVRAVTGLDEIADGDDLAALIGQATSLVDGDVVVVTSKVVSKAEGRVRRGDRATAVEAETERVLARRGDTAIVRTRHGLVLAAAGVDASNTEPGTVVLLPQDPDRSARDLRDRIGSGDGPNVAVVISDTLGRAWRNGQTDVAVGAAGLPVLENLAGSDDGYGNRLEVTEPALADEIAGAADLVTGKLRRCPVALVRGLAHLVLPPGQHGPGARALVRDEGSDMFGHGAREAVTRALHASREDLMGFGQPVSGSELVAALREICPQAEVQDHDSPGRLDVRLLGADDDAGQQLLGADRTKLVATAFALGWTVEPQLSEASPRDVFLRFTSATP